jgi:exonuclease VII large subunit
MAEEDKPKDLKKLTEATQQEMGRILETVTSIADRLIDGIEEFNDKLDESEGKFDVIGKTMKRGLIAEFKNTVKNQENLIKLQLQAEKGQLKSKDIARERQKLEENRRLTELKIENIQKRKGNLSKEEKKIQGQLIADLQAEIDAQEEQLEIIDEINKRNALSKGLTGLIGENIRGYIDDLDKSGVLCCCF